MNQLSWVNTANLIYNSDVFTEWLCKVTVTKQLLLKSCKNCLVNVTVAVNADKQRFYTILWLKCQKQIINFIPLHFLLKLMSREQPHTHGPVRMGQQPWSRREDLRPLLYPTMNTSCSLSSRCWAAPLAGGILRPHFLMLWMGWKWKPTFPVQFFEPSTVEGPSRDSDRLDRSNILAPVTFPFICWSAKQFTTVGQDALVLHDLSQSFL